MKPEELRIGNWVMDVSNPDNPFEKQWTFTDYHHAYDALDGNVSDFYRLGFEPIPITKEWLERFGFKEEDKSEPEHGNFWTKWIYDYAYSFAYAAFRDDWGIYIEYTDSPFPPDHGKKYFIDCGYKHIHQLQNLYYALTGEELH